MDNLTFSFAAKTSSDGNRLMGTVHTYGTVTRKYGEPMKFAPGAFTKVLRNPNTDVVAVWHHKEFMPLARQSAGTLVLEDSNEGLHFALTIPDVSYANDIRMLVDSGLINGMSFSVTA